MATKTVLVVDDEFVIRELLKTWLELEGYQVAVASGGEEGLRRLYQHKPDLIVSDILMPGMDGYEFCGLVRSVSNAPIMMVTGIADVEAEQKKIRQLNLGINAFMSKPILMNEFVSTVRSLLEGSLLKGEASVRTGAFG